MTKTRILIQTSVFTLLAAAALAQNPTYPQISIVSQSRTISLNLQSEGVDPGSQVFHTDGASGNGPFVNSFVDAVSGDDGTAANGATSQNSVLGAFSIVGESETDGTVTSGSSGAFASAEAASSMLIQFTVPVDATFSLAGSLEADGTGAFAAGAADIVVVGIGSNGVPFNINETINSQFSTEPVEFFRVQSVQANAMILLSVTSNSGGVQSMPGTSSGSSRFHFTLDFGDRDADGLLDAWETDGIDVDDDDVAEIDLPAMGADPDHKDVFVELDAMTGIPVDQFALDMVELGLFDAPAAMVANPDGMDGVNLHVQVDETDLAASNFTAAPWPGAFDTLKQEHFGTVADREHPNWDDLKAARKLVFRYCIWADSLTAGGNLSTGLGEIPGDDFIVSAGYIQNSLNSPTDALAGTFMHELGHTLGLRHGGEDGVNYKPNYLSVMNYAYQIPYSDSESAWFLDYSRTRMATLNEASLLDTFGLDGPDDKNLLYNSAAAGLSPVRTVVQADVATIDWNQDGTIAADPDTLDITRIESGSPPTPNQILDGSIDWNHLWFGLSGHANFGAGADRDLSTIPDELGDDEIQAIESTAVIDLTGGVGVGSDTPGFPGFELYAATPNPFNPSTEISFRIPRAAEVELRVYDLAGRLVKTLAAGAQLNGGLHTRRWDGTDDRGRRLASGVYLYQLRAGDYRASRAITLVK